jgi:hypothetical protein
VLETYVRDLMEEKLAEEQGELGERRRAPIPVSSVHAAGE